jgi:hypothetical protein
VGAVADVLEGVQQHDEGGRLLGREPGEVPGQQVGVVRERVDVGVGLQQVREPLAPGERRHVLPVLPQRTHHRPQALPHERAERARQGDGLGDVPEHRLHLLGQRHGGGEPPQEAGRRSVLGRLPVLRVVPLPGLLRWRDVLRAQGFDQEGADAVAAAGLGFGGQAEGDRGAVR